MELNTSIKAVLTALRDLPSADKIMVFGSVAKDAATPGDLDVALCVPECANWNEAKAEHQETIDAMRRLAYRYYGSFDPFVMTASILAVRNDEATGWQKARNAVALKKAIKQDGTPLLELLAKLTVETPPSDGPSI